jgi:hypothetical protein
MMNAYPARIRKRRWTKAFSPGAPRLLPDAPRLPGPRPRRGMDAGRPNGVRGNRGRSAARRGGRRRAQADAHPPTREPYYEQVKASWAHARGRARVRPISDEALSFPLAREYWPAEDAALNDRLRELLGRANVLWSA